MLVAAAGVCVVVVGVTGVCRACALLPHTHTSTHPHTYTLASGSSQSRSSFFSLAQR